MKTPSFNLLTVPFTLAGAPIYARGLTYAAVFSTTWRPPVAGPAPTPWYQDAYAQNCWRHHGFPGHIVWAPEPGHLFLAHMSTTNSAPQPATVRALADAALGPTVGSQEGNCRRCLRDTAAFGWPVAVSYALRNHFLHDGGRRSGASFFEGTTSASGFAINQKAWMDLEEVARAYGVQRDQTRPGLAWPTSPQDDLRVLLDVCETETDEALGVLVSSACHSTVAHLACMIGED